MAVEFVAPSVSSDRLDRLKAISELAISQRKLVDAEALVEASAEEARRLGASWDDIGVAVGITAIAASRRWDPEARRKHRSYQAERRRAAKPNSPS